MIVKKNLVKRALKYAALTLLFLFVILVIHIVVVTRPRVDRTTRVMARIDIHQSMTKSDADKTTAWLYQQNGVDHALCNPSTQIAIFTFSPIKANADNIAAKFREYLHYPNARRYVPTEKEMQGGCPVASTSFVYKTVKFLNHLF